MNIKMKKSYQMKSGRSKIRAINQKVNAISKKNTFHITHKQNTVCYA